jgi:hypothetical protein
MRRPSLFPLWICCLCRESVESRAINQSLKELIDQFLSQKQKVFGDCPVRNDSHFFFSVSFVC